MIWTTQPRSKGAGRLQYWSEGQGPSLVLIHGVGLRAEAWAAVIPELSKTFSVYALDMPGHGDSPLDGAAALPDYVARVAEFISALDGPVYVAGHSMGAMIALELAGQIPDRVAGVAALNSIYRRSPEAASAVQARANALSGQSMSDPEPTLTRWFGTSPEGPMAEAASACRDWLLGANGDGYGAAYRVFANHDGPSDGLLSSLAMPVLFQTGPGDNNSTPAMSSNMAKIALAGRSVIVDGAAHMMPMTHPKNVVTSLLQAFEQGS